MDEPSTLSRFLRKIGITVVNTPLSNAPLQMIEYPDFSVIAKKGSIQVSKFNVDTWIITKVVDKQC